MSQQVNVSPENLRMDLDYIAGFENCCSSAKIGCRGL
jgi:hypothetical protein